MPHARKLTLLFLGLAVLLATTPAYAQYYRYGRRGVVVRSPGVGVSVSPGGVRVSSPYGAYRYGRSWPYPPGAYPYGFYRAPGVTVQTAPRSVSVGVGTAPTPAAAVEVTVSKPEVSATTQRPAPTDVTPAPTLTPAAGGMTEADLAALSQSDLLAVLSDASAELDAELAALNGGSGWQGYLALPESVIAGEADAVKLGKLLGRFDSVARDNQYRPIAGLKSFAAVRTTLRVAVDRLAGQPMTVQDAPVLDGPVESLPLPEANVAPAADESAERSILKL